MQDPDGDQVHCRWAEPLEGECGGVCGAFPGAQLNQVSLTAHYHVLVKAAITGITYLVK